MSRRTDHWYVPRGMAKAALLAAVVAVLAWLIAGCTVIGHREAPNDFPTLRVIEHHVDGGAVIRACYKYVPLWARLLGALPEGCAEVNFADNTCTIYVRGDYPDKRVLEHERLHCRGRDHPNDDAISGAWIRYRDGLMRIGAK